LTKPVRALFFRGFFIEQPCFFIVAVRAVLAAAFTAIAALQVVLFGKHNVSLGAVIKILGIELLFKHGIKVRTLAWIKKAGVIPA
jgi:hypothetical protein